VGGETTEDEEEDEEIEEEDDEVDEEFDEGGMGASSTFPTSGAEPNGFTRDSNDEEKKDRASLFCSTFAVSSIGVLSRAGSLTAELSLLVEEVDSDPEKSQPESNWNQNASTNTSCAECRSETSVFACDNETDTEEGGRGM